ncbi:MAG: hypothetical protein ACI854_002696 [Arenicella sp.]
MIRITGRGLTADMQAAQYSVAGQALVGQTAMAGLASYATGLASRNFTDLLSNFDEPPMMTAANAPLRYSGKAYFDGKFREVRYWRSTNRGQLDVDRVPVCQIDFNESHIHVLNCKSLGVGLNMELITGPALVLLMALRETYCMHAGSVDTKVGRIGIIAESGAGKSTLSQHIGDDWCQVSDDIMPFALNESAQAIDVLPDFPQLKLANNRVENADNAARSLDYLLRVNPAPSDTVSFAVLPRVEAMLQIVRHTVAAKLFDIETLHKHADFAKDVSTLVPVIEVSYPRELDQLDHLRDSIVDYLGSL